MDRKERQGKQRSNRKVTDRRKSNLKSHITMHETDFVITQYV